MLMRWLTQEDSSFHTPAQLLLDDRDMAPRGHQAADRETPVRIEIIDHPIVTLHGGQLAHDVGQMHREILAGACDPEMPQHLPRGHHEGREQGPRAMADILVLPFLWLARLRGLRRIFSLQNLHAGLFIRTDHHAPVLVEAQGVDIQLANVLRFRVKRRVVAIETLLVKSSP
jgi:hypothetical protein